MQQQDPHFHNIYHQHYNNFSNMEPKSITTSQNRHHSRFRKPFIQNINQEYWCETCDRSFPTLDLLDKHKQQHQRCNIDGCQFIAHPKVITKHIQMQHSSGLYHKIAKLNNPEEIQKWRDERKKKYPTKVNVERKTAEIKEKIERGEKMGLKQNKHKNHDRIDIRANKRNRTDGIKHQRGQRQKAYSTTLMVTRKSAVPKKVLVLPTADSSRVLKPFSGIQDIIKEDALEETEAEIQCDFIIDDDDMVKLAAPDNAPSKQLEEPKVCGALSSLMTTYDSSEEELDETSNQTQPNPAKINVNSAINRIENYHSVLDKSNDITASTANKSTVGNDGKSDDDSGPEETNIVKIEDSTSTFQDEPKILKSHKLKQKPTVNFQNRSKFVKPRHKLPSTLLQKLLRKEMQHERNIILQCIRHIVSNKYFDHTNQ